MADDHADERSLLEQARHGDEDALRVLFSRHHGRLSRMVQVRLNRRLWKRIDPADVLQEAYLEISQYLPRYVADPKLPFFLWMRYVVGQKIISVHRQHLGTQKRDAGREVAVNGWGSPSANSMSIARQLLGNLTSPSQAVIKAETRRRVQDALDQMSELDREVLVMRHFEQMTNKEIALALDIRPSAASSRYVRALDHLQKLIAD